MGVLPGGSGIRYQVVLLKRAAYSAYIAVSQAFIWREFLTLFGFGASTFLHFFQSEIDIEATLKLQTHNQTYA